MSLFKRKNQKENSEVMFYEQDVHAVAPLPGSEVTIKIQKLHKDAIIPTYAHSDDACCDVCALEDYTLKPKGKGVFRTGIAIEIPTGYEVQVRSRSGLAMHQSFAVLNAPGTIDAQFRNEVMILGMNFGDKMISIKKGDRIAQMCVKPVYKMAFQQVEKLSESERGLGGWGSTGK